MRAAVTRARKAPALLEELRLEDPRPNEILVRIVATGVCHGDIVARDQVYPVPQPIVLGHEGAGVVEAVGTAVSTLRKGDHVILSYDSCAGVRKLPGPSPDVLPGGVPAKFFGPTAGRDYCFKQWNQKIHSHFFGQSSFATWSLATKENAIRSPRKSRWNCSVRSDAEFKPERAL
jgi:aryl-alcohol dehydrogenase